MMEKKKQDHNHTHSYINAVETITQVHIADDNEKKKAKGTNAPTVIQTWGRHNSLVLNSYKIVIVSSGFHGLKQGTHRHGRC